MKEKWLEYKPDEIPKGKYEIIRVLQDMDGTIIEIESELHQVTLKFGFVDALRISDEGRRLRTYNEVLEIQSYREDFYGTPLYQVLESEFGEWLSLESAGFYTEIKHYVIMTINDIVDILSSDAPEIKVSKL